MLSGRPPIPLDWQKIDEDLEAGCTGVQIAASFGIHRDTLCDRVKDRYGMDFSAYSALKLRAGDDLIRKAQFDKAIGKSKKGDTTLLTFLGRTRLKQVEAQPEKVHEAIPNDSNLNYADAYIKSEADKIEMAREIAKLREEISAFKPKTDTGLFPSNEKIQHMGGGSQVGENIFEYPKAD